MSNLGDELFKAGLLKKKDLKKVKHEQRVERKQKQGQKGQQEDEDRRQQEYSQHKKSQKKRDKALEQEKKQRREAKELRLQATELIKSTLISNFSGPKRFYFETRSGAVPHLNVNDLIARRLEAGELGIVEIGGEKIERFAIVPQETAVRVREVDSNAVRLLNRR